MLSVYGVLIVSTLFHSAILSQNLLSVWGVLLLGTMFIDMLSLELKRSLDYAKDFKWEMPTGFFDLVRMAEDTLQIPEPIGVMPQTESRHPVFSLPHVHTTTTPPVLIGRSFVKALTMVDGAFEPAPELVPIAEQIRIDAFYERSLSEIEEHGVTTITEPSVKAEKKSFIEGYINNRHPRRHARIVWSSGEVSYLPKSVVNNPAFN
jgi:hypothetical protein